MEEQTDVSKHTPPDNATRAAFWHGGLAKRKVCSRRSVPLRGGWVFPFSRLPLRAGILLVNAAGLILSP
jgi:hypothetical protein